MGLTVTDGTFIQTVGSVPLIDYARVTISGGKFSAGSLATATASILSISGGKYTAALAKNVSSHLADGSGLFDNPDSDAETYPKTVLPGPRIVKNSLVLDGVLDLKYYLSVPEDFDGNDAKMEFSLDNQKVNFSQATTEGHYYVFPCHVYGYQMADTITATFTWQEDGETKTLTDTYSVKEYLDALLSDTNINENARALVKALQNYGHYVQPYLQLVNGLTYTSMPPASDKDLDYETAKSKSATAAGTPTTTTFDSTLIPSVSF